MKRTREINLQRMRKRPMQFFLKPLTLALAGAALSGCGSDIERASAFESIEECRRNAPENGASCEAAYQAALFEAERTAPKYQTQADCEYEWGAEQCVQPGQMTEAGQLQGNELAQTDPSQQGQQQGHTSGGSWFMPAMAGFLMGRAMSGAQPQAAPLHASTSPRSPLNGKWTTPDGQVLGNRQQSNLQVNRNVFQPKPAVTRTTSRGGFGAMAAAKSSSPRSSLGG